jgi:hypothetical protein
MSQSIPAEISDFVQLMPDYQNLDFDWSWHKKLASHRGEDRVDRLLWNDLVDCSEEIANFLMQNPGQAERYGKEIKAMVNNIFPHLVDNTRDDIVHAIKRYVSGTALTTSLPKEWADMTTSEILASDFYHGTGDKALPGIAKYQALLSEAELARRRNSVLTGENELGRLPRKNYFVCMTQWPSKAEQYACADGVRRLDDYPVILGFSKEKIDALGKAHEIYGINMDMDGGEVSLIVPVPLSCATQAYAPLKKLDEVKRWSEKNGIENTVPLELFLREIGHQDVFIYRPGR